MSSEQSSFDRIIEQIGNAGRYQQRFNYVFNFGLVIVATMPHFNLLISLATPDHWCHVPGREDSNLTDLEWKEMYIPKEYDSRGILIFSKCKRYVQPKLPHTNRSEEVVEKCPLGWEYDRTWYDSTAPMQNDWVCNHEMVTVNTLAIGRFGEFIGTLIIGHLADRYGRRPVFFTALATIIIGRLMSSMTSSWVFAFFLSAFIGSMPSTSVFQGPLVIAMEISRPEDRAYVSMLQYVGWNIALIILPLLMWWLRNWVPFLIITTVPCAIFLLSRRWIIESPRWLVCQGQVRRCLEEMATVAKANKTEMPANAEVLLTRLYQNQKKEKNRNVCHLFSSARLAKNAILLVGCWTILMMIYMTITMNVNNLSGNPFLNYMFQAFAEFPAYLIGKYVSDKYGRRWTSFFSYLITALACIPVLFIVHDERYTLALCGISVFLKFSIALAFYSINLQSMEIYPTCVRQTGISVSVIFGSGFGVVTPYIISMGTSINAAIPYAIFLASSIFACIFCLFLPETLGYELPETLNDASRFGSDQDFWGRRKTQRGIAQGADVPLECHEMLLQ